MIHAVKVLLALCLLSPAWGQVAVPPLEARVTDTTGTLTAQQKGELEQRLAAFEARKGSQIAVLMLPTTGGEPIEQYALRAAEQWKVGRKKVDDGALLVVAKDDRALRIEVGYGLEGVLNDLTARRIIADTIVPRFRAGDFFGGLSAGLERMMQVMDGEQLPAPAARSPAAGSPVFESLPVLLVVAVFGGLALRRMFGRFFGSLGAGGVVGFLVWTLSGALLMALLAAVVAFVFALLGSSGARFSPGYYGGFPGGGMPRGGGWGGGGGWRGGGGTFGGGGASGRW